MSSQSEDDLFSERDLFVAENAQKLKEAGHPACATALVKFAELKAEAEGPPDVGLVDGMRLEELRQWYVEEQLRICLETNTRFLTPAEHKCVRADTDCEPSLKCQWDRPRGGSLFACRQSFTEHWCDWASGGVMVCNYRKDEDGRSVCGLTGADRGPSDLRMEASWTSFSVERIKHPKDPNAPPKPRTLTDAIKTEAGGIARGDQIHELTTRAHGCIGKMLKPEAVATFSPQLRQRLARLCVDLWVKLAATKSFADNKNRLHYVRFCAAVVYFHRSGHTSGLIVKDAALGSCLRGTDEMCALLGRGARRKWFTVVTDVLQDCLNEAKVMKLGLV